MARTVGRVKHWLLPRLAGPVPLVATVLRRQRTHLFLVPLVPEVVAADMQVGTQDCMVLVVAVVAVRPMGPTVVRVVTGLTASLWC
jgi:hypothetical protein